MSGRWAARQVLDCPVGVCRQLLLLLLGLQLSSHLDSFLKACFLFAMVRKREQMSIATGAWEDSRDSTDMWITRTTYPGSFSFLFSDFPTPGRTWLTWSLPLYWLELSAFGGFQPLCAKAITSTLWSRAYQRAAELCTFISLVFLFPFGFLLW